MKILLITYVMIEKKLYVYKYLINKREKKLFYTKKMYFYSPVRIASIYTHSHTYIQITFSLLLTYSHIYILFFICTNCHMIEISKKLISKLQSIRRRCTYEKLLLVSNVFFVFFRVGNTLFINYFGFVS